jgi:hypothetical protein
VLANLKTKTVTHYQDMASKYLNIANTHSNHVVRKAAMELVKKYTKLVQKNRIAND